jgi:hypothetical protein
MSDALPEFEVVNSEGSTTKLSGTTPVTPSNSVLLPNISSNVIESFTITNLSPLDDGVQSPLVNINSEIYFSLDDGVTYETLLAGYEDTIKPKGIKQIRVKANVANVPYSIRINFEVFE